MKTTRQKNHSKKSLILMAVSLSAMLFLGSCSKKVTFPVSSVVPAAQGDVKVKQDKNSNYEIEVKVMHLAPPERLDPSKKVYVVWIETARKGPQNVGRLKSSSSMVSSALKGSLKAVTPFKPTAVFITAEESANIQYPGRLEVLRTDSFDVK